MFHSLVTKEIVQDYFVVIISKWGHHTYLFEQEITVGGQACD